MNIDRKAGDKHTSTILKDQERQSQSRGPLDQGAYHFKNYSGQKVITATQKDKFRQKRPLNESQCWINV